MELIVLKNLQDSRICHVLMWLAKSGGYVLYRTRDFQSAAALGTVSMAGISV
jgi:hypothetical protein